MDPARPADATSEAPEYPSGMVKLSSPPIFTESKRVTYWSRLRVRTAVLWTAGLLLASSACLPYWQITVITPAQPRGVPFVSYLSDLHRPLQSALAKAGEKSDARRQDLAKLERSLVVAIVTVIALLGVAAALARRRWGILLALPSLFFPLIVVADTARWLRSALAARAVAEGSFAPIPDFFAFGRMVFRRFVLEFRPGVGLALAFAASIAVAAGVWLHFMAHRSTG